MFPGSLLRCVVDVGHPGVGLDCDGLELSGERGVLLFRVVYDGLFILLLDTLPGHVLGLLCFAFVRPVRNLAFLLLVAPETIICQFCTVRVRCGLGSLGFFEWRRCNVQGRQFIRGCNVRSH